MRYCFFFFSSFSVKPFLEHIGTFFSETIKPRNLKCLPGVLSLLINTDSFFHIWKLNISGVMILRSIKNAVKNSVIKRNYNSLDINQIVLKK